MKIRTARDVEKLDLKIKEELGVDVKEYRNEEAVESLESSLEIAQRIDTRDSSFLAIVYFNLAYPVENINQDNRAYELVEKSAAELAKLKSRENISLGE